MAQWAHRQLHCTTDDCTWQVLVVMPFADDHSYPKLLLRAHGDDGARHSRVQGVLVDVESGETVARFEL